MEHVVGMSRRSPRHSNNVILFVFPSIGASAQWERRDVGWNRDAIGAWVYACSPPHTQGCGPSALPLGYLGIHRFAVRGSKGRRDGRRVAAGRLVRGLAWRAARMNPRAAWPRWERGSRFEGATRWPPRCGRPVGARIGVRRCAGESSNRMAPVGARLALRRGNAMAAALRQAGWWTDCGGIRDFPRDAPRVRGYRSQGSDVTPRGS